MEARNDRANREESEIVRSEKARENQYAGEEDRLDASPLRASPDERAPGLGSEWLTHAAADLSRLALLYAGRDELIVLCPHRISAVCVSNSSCRCISKLSRQV